MDWDEWIRFRYGDPQVDLLWLKDGDRDFEQVYEIALENTERLISEQAFNRGLTEALEIVIDIVYEDEPCRCYEEEGEYPYYCDRCSAIGKARFVLDKAKGVRKWEE